MNDQSDELIQSILQISRIKLQKKQIELKNLHLHL